MNNTTPVTAAPVTVVVAIAAYRRSLAKCAKRAKRLARLARLAPRGARACARASFRAEASARLERLAVRQAWEAYSLAWERVSRLPVWEREEVREGLEVLWRPRAYNLYG